MLKKQDEGDNTDVTAARLNEIYEELHVTGADSAESRVCCFGCIPLFSQTFIDNDALTRYIDSLTKCFDLGSSYLIRIGL